MKAVQFDNGPIKMAANLFVPPGFDPSKTYASIVCVHPGDGVKEQTARIYAAKLAEAGFVTLAFDASHQGASGAEPRFPMTRCDAGQTFIAPTTISRRCPAASHPSRDAKT